MDAASLKLIKAWRADWNQFCRDVLCIRLDKAQQEIVHSVQVNRRTIVRSGHARGKDFVGAAISLCFLYLESPSKVICTAPTGRQVNNIMLAESRTMWNKAMAELEKRGGGMGGYWRGDGIRFCLPNGEADPEHFLLGFKAADKATEAWTGYHSPNLMVVVTEGSGIEQVTFDAIEGVLTGNSRLYVALNPNHCQGETYTAFASSLYSKFTLSCLDAPNVVSGKVDIPGQVDRTWISERILKPGWVTEITADEVMSEEGDFAWDLGDGRGKRWYRPGDLFRVKVLGLFPRESDDQLIPLSWVEAAQERWHDWIEAGATLKGPLRLGVDVAGMGTDATVLAARYGNVVQGVKVLASRDHMATAGKVLNALKGKKEARAYVDTIGEGAGVHSRLAELNQPSVSVKFSESAAGRTDLTEEREFANMRAYCYWALRDALDPKLKEVGGGMLALPPSDELAQDLTAPRWQVNSAGRILLEKKDDIKERLGRSPDYGDALANTFYPDGATAEFHPDAFAGLGVFGG